MADHHIDLEAELRAAMNDRAAALPRPLIDLHRIRRRAAVRRRLAVGVLIAILALTIAAPLAFAHRMVPLPRPGGSKAGGISLPSATSRQPLSGGARPDIVAGGTSSSQRTAPDSAAQPAPSVPQRNSPGSATGTLPGCASRRGPLPASERATLEDDALVARTSGQSTLRSQLGEAGDVDFSDRDVDHLLPAVGSPVQLEDCAGHQRLAEQERDAILQQVRAAVLVTGAVTSAVSDQLTGAIAGAPEVAAVRRTSDTIVVSAVLGGLPQADSLVITMRLPDCAVSEVDLSHLETIDLGPLNSFDAIRLRDRLHELGPALSGTAPGVLTPDFTVVPPSTP